MLVFRHDTRAWADVPESALRWGPDTGESTCRAGLLFRETFLREGQPVRYLIPFPGAKWAVRVDIPVAGTAEPGFSDRWFRAKSALAARRPGDMLLLGIARHPGAVALIYADEAGCGGQLIVTGLEADWIWNGKASGPFAPVAAGNARLGALLDAAADALALELREPDAALELLAEALPFIGYHGPAGDLRDRIRALLHRETLSHG